MTSNFGPNKEAATSKISADMFSSCYNKISDDTVHSVFNNLTFIEFEWSEDLNKLAKLDYSKYRSLNDLNLTPEQQMLFYKLEKAKNEFIVTNRERQEKAAKSLPPIFGIDIWNVSASTKILYLLVVFALFAFGIVYLLGKVQKKKEEKKKKKNKKE